MQREPGSPVVVDERLGLSSIHLETVAHDRFGVVFPLKERLAADVAHARFGRLVVVYVVHVLVWTGASARDAADYLIIRNNDEERRVEAMFAQPAEYNHPVLKEITEETHGVMVYQEQVMQILNRLGKIPLAAAYTCIKAISKKKEEIIARNYEEFMKGSQEQGMSKNEAQTLWNMILKFAGYGFNKCLVAETVIQDANSGQRTTIGDLFHNRRPFVVHSLDASGKLKKRNVTDVVWNGRKRVYRLTTASGLMLRATGNHPLKTLEGWTQLEHLRPGDRIAKPRN